MKKSKKFILICLLSLLINSIGNVPRANAVAWLVFDNGSSPEAGWAYIYCLLPPLLFLLPVCLLGEEGAGNELPTKAMLLENGYSDEKATSISLELKELGEEMKLAGKYLKIEKGDDAQKVSSTTGLSLEASQALLEISGWK